MGHDVYGFKDKKRSVEIAYLRRSAFDERARDIYRVLGAEKYDAGVSGDGSSAWFTRGQLQDALPRLPVGDTHAREREFIERLIANGSPSGAYIGFY